MKGLDVTNGEKYELGKAVYVCYAEIRYGSGVGRSSIAYAYLIGVVSGIQLRLGNFSLIEKMYILKTDKVRRILNSGESIYNLTYNRQHNSLSCPAWHGVNEKELVRNINSDGLVKPDSYLYVVRNSSFKSSQELDFIKFLITTFDSNAVKQRLYLALGCGYLFPKEVVKTFTQSEMESIVESSRIEGKAIINCGNLATLISNKASNKHLLVVPDSTVQLTGVFQGMKLHGEITVIGGGPNLLAIDAVFMGQDFSSINLNGFCTSSVRDMSYLFKDCHNLEQLKIQNLDTSLVVCMLGMFQGCDRLKAIDLSGFNTVSVTNMDYMFSGCSLLKSVNLSNFYTGELISAIGLFHLCPSLISVNLSGFTARSMTDTKVCLSSMFDDRHELSELLVGLRYAKYFWEKRRFYD